MTVKKFELIAWGYKATYKLGQVSFCHFDWDIFKLTFQKKQLSITNSLTFNASKVFEYENI